MKKNLIYILLTAFIISIIGVPITLHYCDMMKQASVASCNVCKFENDNLNSICCNDYQIFQGEKILNADSNCCSDKYYVNKIQDDYLSNTFETKSILLSEILNHPVLILSNNYNFNLTETFNRDNSPPFAEETNIYILNSNFRI